MSDPGVTVVVPVGPEAHHALFLEECLDSIIAQTRNPDEVLLVDDMAQLRYYTGCAVQRVGNGALPITVWRSPWRLGVASAFNVGVARAGHDLVFMLGADDMLLPDCLERCLAAYLANDRADAYYGVGVRYSDGQPDQYLPCNAAMVTKGLWRQTGGFPPEAGSGAPDAALLSILLGNGCAPIVMVPSPEPLYWYRVHNGTDTAGRGPWQGVILETRNLLTAQWRQPQWGRYS